MLLKLSSPFSSPTQTKKNIYIYIKAGESFGMILSCRKKKCDYSIWWIIQRSVRHQSISACRPFSFSFLLSGSMEVDGKVHGSGSYRSLVVMA